MIRSLIFTLLFASASFAQEVRRIPIFSDCFNQCVADYSDFIGAAIGELTSAVSGTGAANSWTTGTTANPGVLQHTTGTTATGRAAAHGNLAGLLFASGQTWTFETIARLTTLSDGTQTYSYRVGFIDSISAESRDGCFFRYTNGTNSGNWQAVCRSNSTESVINSAVAPTANTFQKLRIIVTGTGNAEFWIANTSIGSITTNIPSAGGREFGYGSFILKSLGVTARTAQVDYFYLRGDLGANR